ncbi:hypothetical protein [Streptomyces pratensis]|uniref:hypothetical protein n=1 Tax=Streptomyces pratensis TaxID=1169025 RepID=UPI0036417DFB
MRPVPVPAAEPPDAESREDRMYATRPFCASVLSDAGENVKALAETSATRAPD